MLETLSSSKRKEYSSALASDDLAVPPGAAPCPELITDYQIH